MNEQRKFAAIQYHAPGGTPGTVTPGRYLADLRLEMIEMIAGMQLAQETREEYRLAIRRYVREERKKSREQ